VPQPTATAEMGIWRPTAVGSLVADVTAIKAAGGSRKVTLPNSTLRIADLEWQEVKDVEGRVMCWQRTIAGVRVLIRNNSPQEETMSKKTKRDHGTATEPKPVSYTLPEPVAEAPKAEVKDAEPQAPEKAPRSPKAIGYSPSGEPIRAVKAGTKLALLIDLLARPEGATLEELATELSRTGSKVDVAAARSWISYDLRRTGLGVVQPDDHLHLVGTPLPHRVAEPKKAAESKAAEPKLQIVKRAAGSGKPKSKKVKAGK